VFPDLFDDVGYEGVRVKIESASLPFSAAQFAPSGVEIPGVNEKSAPIRRFPLRKRKGVSRRRPLGP